MGAQESFAYLTQAGTPVADVPALTGNFVYVVRWPDGVVKVGCAGSRSRWRQFVCRGAELMQLCSFPTGAEALHAEAVVQESLKRSYSPAFDTREEATLHTGDGGGYLECFYMPEFDHE